MDNETPDYIKDHVARHEAIMRQRREEADRFRASNPWPLDASASGINPSDVSGYGWIRVRGD